MSMTQMEARRIAVKLLRDNGLGDWTVKFDRAKTRAGQCHAGKREISLSAPLLKVRSREESMNTITHEIAHAIVGPRHGHDRVWQRKHRELGGDGKRCFTDTKAIREQAPWIGRCAHGVETGRFRRPKQMHGWRCRCPQGSSEVHWHQNRKAR